MLTSNVVTVGTAVTRIVQAQGSPLIVDIHNESGQALYIGGTGIAVGTGFHIDSHEHFNMVIHPGNTLYGIANQPISVVVMGQQL